MQININLLPKSKIKENEKNFISRFVSAQLFFVLFILLCASAVLFGMELSLKMKMINLEKIEREAEDEKITQAINKYEDKFTNVNDSVNLISSIQSGHFNWINLFNELNINVPDNIQLTGLSNKDFLLLLSGVAKSRDDLLVFESNLMDSACFSDVNLPFSYLAAKDNVKFQLDAQIKLECLIK